jgi:hypothetical protein
VAPGGDRLHADPDEAFVELVPVPDSLFLSTVLFLRDTYGIRILTAFVPDGIICRATSEQIEMLSADSLVSLVATSEIPGVVSREETELTVGDAGLGRLIWNDHLAPHEPIGLSLPAPIPAPGDVDSTRVEGQPENDKHRQTSTYMLGLIGFSVILLESSDSGPCYPSLTENWTNDEKILCMEEHLEMAERIDESDPNDESVIWLADFITKIVPQEPIKGPHNDESWGLNALGQLGYTSGDLTTRIFAYNNDRRRAEKSDWYYTCLVVHDLCDQDGRFTDGISSFSRPGGPYMVTTLTNGGHDPEVADGYIAYHTCHIFGAAPEGLYSGCVNHCSDTYGYLHVSNGNCSSCTGQPSVPCLLYEITYPYHLCTYTRGQIGWRDSDSPSDGTYDPHEQPFATSLAFVEHDESYPARPGDYLDIWDQGMNWVKRIAVTENNVWDRGFETLMMWDGYDYAGNRLQNQTIHYETNDSGNWQTGYLGTDSVVPWIYDVSWNDGNPTTLSYCFDTSVQAHVTIKRLGWYRDWARVRDKTYSDDGNGNRCHSIPVTLGNQPPQAGIWTAQIHAWRSGGGREDLETVTIAHGGPTLVPENGSETGMSRQAGSTPNPSTGSVRWRIPAGYGPIQDLRIHSVDGRLIRTVAVDDSPKGVWWVFWDGRDDQGHSVPGGQYFLIGRSSGNELKFGRVTLVR